MKKYTIIIEYLLDGEMKRAYFPQDNAKALCNMGKYESEIRYKEGISADYIDFSIDEIIVSLTADL